MRILDWLQSKLNGTKKTDPISTSNRILQEARQEEFCDWPNELLAIGTLGNDDFKEQERSNFPEENPSSSEDHIQGLTKEEVGKIRDKLKSLLMYKQQESSSEAELEAINLALDKIPENASSFDIDHTVMAVASPDASRNKSGHRLQPANSDIGKKSLTFLLKRVFVCRSGFAPTPSLKDPIPESRMEKILKAILRKKIYPQGSGTSALSKKKYLPNRHIKKSNNEDKKMNKGANGSKWVKTDSEYIVLEI